ncbi:MAG: RidA family protein [Synechococcaceae cyanobacterium SM2_3_1]|nr:RidA family protein [Synechococcaceae cyanobacterium SM2_3_1]
MAERQLIASGTPWEAYVGYSRAIRVGDWIEVSGTVAADETGEVVGAGDAYAQTRFILDKIEKALISAGSGLKDVIRTRIYVTNIADWDAIGRAHGEVFAQIRPASTLVEIKGLIHPEFLLEIEANAQVVNSD